VIHLQPRELFVNGLHISHGGGRVQMASGVDVDWHESQKLLKLAFPLDIRADRYAVETQFGHLVRPTRNNTSRGPMKFDTCNHRFVHFAELGCGVAVVNDATYGHDVTPTVRVNGATTVTTPQRRVRAPRLPNPEADEGTHRGRPVALALAAVPHRHASFASKLNRGGLAYGWDDIALITWRRGDGHRTALMPPGRTWARRAAHGVQRPADPKPAPCTP
jgi:hypothetical protein